MTHQTVFRQQAVKWLQVQPDHWYLDATFGGGGHTAEILARGGKVLALDYDESCITAGQSTFAEAIVAGRLILERENFRHLTDVLSQHALSGQLAGGLFDLGTNTDQLMSGKQGLSVYEDGPLDMRLDESLAVTAHDLLMALSEKELANLFAEYGGESYARPIAQAISRAKKKEGSDALQTSQELAELITKVKPKRGHLHPATKVFQALRIAVNDEIGNLETALPAAFGALAPGGRLVVIAFHEGEDRPVKTYFRQVATHGQGIILTKKPIVPTDEELVNRRARSAKMRVIEKLAVNKNQLESEQ